jgi:hypothetical protein
MAVSVVGIILNLVILIIIIIVIIVALSYRSELQICEANPSPLCYTIACPCDDPTPGPCFGYAKRPGPANKPDTWYCSNASQTLVDSSGKTVSG